MSASGDGRGKKRRDTNKSRCECAERALPSSKAEESRVGSVDSLLRQETAASSRPSKELFVLPLIRSLGKLSEFCPRSPVPRERVLQEVLYELGINPVDPPWPLTSRGGPPGIYRLIGKAFRDLCRAEDAICFSCGPEGWALTDHGCSHASQLCSVDDEVKGDLRDKPGWVIVELSQLGERKLREGTLSSSIRTDLALDDNFPIFLPAVRVRRNGRMDTMHLIEGYAFIGAGLDEVDYFSLERKGYVAQVMSSEGVEGSVRVLHVVDDSHVERLKSQLRQLATTSLVEGMLVKIRDGDYRKLEATIILLEQDYAHVRIDLHSRIICTRLPKAYLEPFDPE